MYESHFGMSTAPFVETVDPAAFVSLPSREACLRRLRFGLEHGRGPVVLFGNPGTGKSILLRHLAVELRREAIELPFPLLPANEILHYLVQAVGVAFTPAASSSSTYVRALRDGLAERSSRGDRALLIVDDCHLIDDPATWDALRLLLNFASAGPPDLDLVLAGDTSLWLRIPPALADRLAAWCLLEPLSGEESASYILGRLRAARAQGVLFPSETLAAIYRAALGLPRRLNRLADLCLLIAYAREIDRVGPDVVELAARELDPESRAA